MVVATSYYTEQEMDTEKAIPEPEDRHGGAGREPPWKLNVQGVTIESRLPTIVARDAITKAGFDPEAGWIIVLKVAGAPRKEIDLNSDRPPTFGHREATAHPPADQQR
jgi:hypothetical protein